MSAVCEKIQQYYRDNLDVYQEKCDLFIAALEEKPIIRRACQQAGLDRTTPYVWRANDPGFRQRWDNALESGADEAEHSLFDMAVSRKNVVATIFYLKGNRAKYRDRLTVDVTAMEREIEERLDSQLQSSGSQANSMSAQPVKALLTEMLTDVSGGSTSQG